MPSAPIMNHEGGADPDPDGPLPSPPSPHQAAVYDALVDPPLLRLIASFQRGVPEPLLRLRRQHPTLFTSPQLQSTTERFLVLALAHGSLRDVMLAHRYGQSPEHPSPLSPSWAQAEAARRGRLDAATWLWGQLRAPWPKDVLADTCARGYMDVARWLVRAHGDAFDAASATPCLEVPGLGLEFVQELVTRFPPIVTPRSFRKAAAHGNIAVIRYLQEVAPVPCALHWGAVDDAARRGDLEALRVLYENPRQRGSTRAMDAAAARGDLAIVRFLHEHGRVGCTTKALDVAAGNGHLEVVRFLHEHRTEGGTYLAMNWAAWRGHLAIVEFLHGHRHEGCTEAAIDRAAQCGHTEVVAFLLAHRDEGYTRTTVPEAAANGHLDVVRLMHEEYGVAVNDYVLVNAARNGHIEIVRYVLAQPETPAWYFVSQAISGADANGHAEIAALIREARPHIDGEDEGWPRGLADAYDVYDYRRSYRHCPVQRKH